MADDREHSDDPSTPEDGEEGAARASASPCVESGGEAVDGENPPGTVRIEDLTDQNGRLVLSPEPSSDPNDPLNWSAARKAVNFGIVCFYALMQMVLLNIGTVIWTQLNDELGISVDDLNISFAANTAGLAIGCIFLVPFAINYGRRSVYLFTVVVAFATAIWQAKMQTSLELILINAINGLTGAASEVLIQMTVRDLFFVHQRATMNGIYILMVALGTFLAPVASGYIADDQGWRWLWWWSAIFLGISTVAIALAYEETKYSFQKSQRPEPLGEVDGQTNPPRVPKARPYRERMAIITPTPGGSVSFFTLLKDFCVLLFTFPAVTYCALIYGSLLAWFAVVLTTMAIYFGDPPYNFGSTGIGLLNLAPFLGSALGALFGGPLNDWLIIRLARRNNGIFEPESRLWMAFLGVFFTPVGILLYGYSLSDGKPWIVPCVGMAMFGFGVAVLGDTSLTYLTDCYTDITGDALVGVTFLRNALATLVVIVQFPWIDAIGLHDFFTSVGVICFCLLLTTIPMMVFGKRLRTWTARRYVAMAKKAGGR